MLKDEGSTNLHCDATVAIEISRTAKTTLLLTATYNF